MGSEKQTQQYPQQDMQDMLWSEAEIRMVQHQVPCEGKTPTPEELFAFLSGLIRDLAKEFEIELTDEM